ncbi:MAG TPA: multicopper oxidase domain-containing protein [Gemmatimonadota bacterium]|nr:multicopper oxidase domain-containing protein [Gemmatimonadota bacterium]
MNTLKSIAAVLAALLALGAFTLRPESVGEIERVDFADLRTTTEPAFDARIAPASHARVKEFRIPITHDTIEIADGQPYEGWTFGGTVPGPAVRVREGDQVRIVLVNESPMGHSIDLHSARIPMNEAFRTIPPGSKLEFEFEARDPGVYLIHCGTPPVLMHLMQGMYMTIIVDPEGGWGTEADKEFVIVQSEFYAREGEGDAAQPNWEAALATQPTQVVFNGRAFQYKKTPLEVAVGDRVRFFVANAGPSLRSDFHVVGAIFDRVIPDGNPENALEHIQTWTVPAGGGAVFETIFEAGASGEGVYAFVTHAFADAEKGAVGLIQVGQPDLAAGVGH